MPKRYLVALLFAISPLAAQHRVDLRNTYHRLVAVVPMVGAGTAADPLRPAYAPLPVPGKAPSRSGIIAFTWQLSDDKKSAIVEFVAADRAALAPILSDKAIKAFEKGKVKKGDIESEVKKYKKDIDLDKLGVMVP